MVLPLQEDRHAPEPSPGGNAYRLCAGCGYQCSLTAGTVMENTKLPLRVWYLAMHLLGQAKNGISALELLAAIRHTPTPTPMRMLRQLETPC